MVESLNQGANIIYNFSATNPDNVHEQEQEDEHEVNYLNTDNEFTHVTEINEDNVIESKSQTQDLFSIFPDNSNENVSLSRNSSISRQNSIQLSDNESIQQSTPPSRPTTPHNITFTTHNASDFNKGI